MDSSSSTPDRSPSTLERIDRVCLRFEDAWRTGAPPDLEAYLGEVPQPEREPLFRELLRLELHYRGQRGETPQAADYTRRFPTFARLVAQTFEQARACPACRRLGFEPGPRCPFCGADLEPGEPGGGPGTFLPAETAAGPPVEPVRPSAGRFLPGTLLAGRYRIVSLVGRGGMGEVYRADDLKLGLAVALKFLPPHLARDPAGRECLYNEVRLARRIAHPNVCRVYDVGEVAGQVFVSMEYVDGEDLARVQRRIGRLPPERGLTITKQLAAGLAAAHEQGVLHCDLKPANILLDGRGQVRITDFGIAQLATAAGRFRAGTPAYMAPEQLAGQPPSVQSDLHALGLVLLELFTGEPAFPTTTLDELLRLKQEARPPGRNLPAGLDPALRLVIRQCLEREPGARPASAAALLAALPGGTLLDAALAAGQTPSPELVAVAGQRGGLPPWQGALVVLAVVLGLAVVCVLGDHTSPLGRIDLRPPDLLAEQARTLLRELGHDDPPRDRAHGFAHAEPARDGVPVLFWHRQGPVRLAPVLFAGSTFAAGQGAVTPADPPLSPGEAVVWLDPEGRLVRLQAVASPRPDSPRTRTVSGGDVPAWCRPLLGRAGLLGPSGQALPASFAPAAFLPAGPADDWRCWEGSCPRRQVRLRVEAAASGGAPVHFRCTLAGAEAEAAPPRGLPRAVYRGAVIVLCVVLIGGAAVLVRANLNRGRGDRRGALRLVAVVFVLSLLAWCLLAGPGLRPPAWPVFLMGVQLALYRAAVLWLFYLAVEPYVREWWPQTLIGWSRLLAGRWQDPLVGRDVLFGVLGGVATRLLWQATILAPGWLGLGAAAPFGAERGPFRVPLHTLLGARPCAGQLLAVAVEAILSGLTVLLLLFLLRLLLRRQGLAAAAYVGVGVLLWPVGVGHPAVSWVTAGLTSALVVWLVTRFGLLTVVSYTFTRLVLNYPLTADGSSWYAGNTSLFALAALTALALAAWRVTSRGLQGAAPAGPPTVSLPLPGGA